LIFKWNSFDSRGLPAAEEASAFALAGGANRSITVCQA
jgi:hypothetical protein